MKIGYVGAGAMGWPMIQRLNEAHSGNVRVCDTDKELVERAAQELGVGTASSPADLAADSDILFSCVPNNDVVREVYLGGEGVITSACPDTVTIDCSTVGPDVTREVYDALRASSVSHLDASMLGSVTQANEGTISFVVGGDEEAFERAKPVLEICGKMIRHCGPSGAGNHMKLIHQTLVAGHAVAVAEAMGLCLETGADIETFYDIATQGTGFAYSRYFENRVPRMREGDFSALFMLKFMLKDARLAREMVPNADEKFPMLDKVISTLEEAAAAGYGDADFSAAMRAIEARIGAKIDA